MYRLILENGEEITTASPDRALEIIAGLRSNDILVTEILAPNGKAISIFELEG